MIDKPQPDWADEIAMKLFPEAPKSEGEVGLIHIAFGNLRGEMAKQLRKAKADGMREAAETLRGVNYRLFAWADDLCAEADKIERGEE